MNESIEAKVECPFYLRSTKRSIVCEGITEQTELTSKFDTEMAKTYHHLDFCSYRTFKNCPVYLAIIKKY